MPKLRIFAVHEFPPMLAVLNIVAPVFVLVTLGYLAVMLKLFPREGVSGLLTYVNTFAAPCLLFRAMLSVDLASAFNPAILVPFYLSVALMMAAGFFVARRLFGRTPGEAVVAGFSAMFSNLILIGLPITQRAFGADAIPVVYSIVGLHAPLLVSSGMLLMEIMRRDGGRLSVALAQGGKNALTNPLLIGIVLGLVGNLLGLRLGGVIDDVTGLLAGSVMPVALFALGGALNSYRLADNWFLALVLSALKLAVQPTIVWFLTVPVLGVDFEVARVVILLSAMPVGFNAYIFASYYNRSLDIAASTILLSAMISVISISAWLLILGV